MSSKIMIFLIAFCVVTLSYFGVYQKAKQIQGELTMIAKETLAQTEMKIDSLKVDGRDLHLKGIVPTKEVKKLALEKIESIQGIRKINSRIIIEAVSGELQNSNVMQNNLNIIGELTIRFAPNSAVIDEENKRLLKNFLQHFNYNQSSAIRISGHTDANGDKMGNILLSRERAESVKEFLVSEGISPQRVLTTGYGSSQPVADNSSETGWQKNRRVELLVFNQEN